MFPHTVSHRSSVINGAPHTEGERPSIMVNRAQSLNSFRWTQCFTQATHKIKDRSLSCSWATEATGAVKQLC